MAIKTLCDQKIIRLHDLKGNCLRDLVALGGIFQDTLQVARHLMDKHFNRMISRRLVLKGGERRGDACARFRPLPGHGRQDAALGLRLGHENGADGAGGGVFRG